MKKTSIRNHHDKILNIIAMGAFILTAIVFVLLLYYTKFLVGSSSGLH